MLASLHIENIAVIESADIEFSPGFNVLTGETGAGKSIIVDSIGAVLGARTSRELVRSGAERAYVAALIRALPEESLTALSGIGIEPDEDGCVLIQRSLSPDGHSGCRINGRPATAALLRSAAPFLINIHGQHDSQQLLNDDFHGQYLDAYANTGELLAAYRESYAVYRKTVAEIEKLTMDDAEKARRTDMLRFQISQLERARLTEGEDERLEARRSLLANAEKLSSAIEEASVLLYGTGDGQGAVAELKNAALALDRVARYREDIAAQYEVLKDLAIRLDEAARDVMRLGDGIEYSEAELDKIESRLDLLSKLSRRYGGSVAEMLAYLENCRAELETIEYSESRREELEALAKKQYAAALERARAVSKRRHESARELERDITAELEYLDMPRTRFVVNIETQESEKVKLGSDGIDKINFLLSVNRGEQPRPLDRVASGGELSRVMLAIKNVLARTDSVQTMVFDEVDTGISGRAAQKVARKLAQVARGRQVLCVTHLTQIAAMADRQFLIEKTERDGRTFTLVEPLDEDGRARELARINSGESITDAAIAAAREMLRQCRDFKAGLDAPRQ